LAQVRHPEEGVRPRLPAAVRRHGARRRLSGHRLAGAAGRRIGGEVLTGRPRVGAGALLAIAALFVAPPPGVATSTSVAAAPGATATVPGATATVPGATATVP